MAGPLAPWKATPALITLLVGLVGPVVLTMVAGARSSTALDAPFATRPE